MGEECAGPGVKPCNGAHILIRQCEIKKPSTALAKGRPCLMGNMIFDKVTYSILIPPFSFSHLFFYFCSSTGGTIVT